MDPKKKITKQIKSLDEAECLLENARDWGKTWVQSLPYGPEKVLSPFWVSISSSLKWTPGLRQVVRKGILLLGKWPSRSGGGGEKCNETVPLARPRARPVTAAACTSWGPTAAPPAGRESDAPPLALTRHVDAKEDALGRGKLVFRSPGLPEDQEVWKQRRQPGLYGPQRRHHRPLARRHSGGGSSEIFRRTTGNSVPPRSSQSATTALTGPSRQPISAGFLGAPPTCFHRLCARCGLRGGRGGRRAGRCLRRSKAWRFKISFKREAAFTIKLITWDKYQ